MCVNQTQGMVFTRYPELSRKINLDDKARGSVFPKLRINYKINKIFSYIRFYVKKVHVHNE